MRRKFWQSLKKFCPCVQSHLKYSKISDGSLLKVATRQNDGNRFEQPSRLWLSPLTTINIPITFYYMALVSGQYDARSD